MRGRKEEARSKDWGPDPMETRAFLRSLAFTSGEKMVLSQGELGFVF